VKIKILFAFFILSLTQSIAAQALDLDPKKWSIALSKKNSFNEQSFTELISSLSQVDSLKTFQFLDELFRNANSEQYHFNARFNCLKAKVISNILAAKTYKDKNFVGIDKIKPQLIGLYANALEMAYRSEDDALIAFVSYEYSAAMVQFNETGISVMYLKNAMDLNEKMNHPVVPQQYQALAELLYIVEEYNESIFYAEKAILGWTKSTYKSRDNQILTCINTAALGYHRQYKYDSALLFYNQALQIARRLNHTVWVGIVSGNIGQIFYARGKYDTAYTLLKQDYQWSKNAGGFGDAANSLQWAARTNLAMGNKTQALGEVREAIRLLKIAQQAGYMRNTYYAATEIFRELGVYDSAFYYNNLYNKIMIPWRK
jgi:tetratricopeptide (TPR) repeat protein